VLEAHRLVQVNGVRELSVGFKVQACCPNVSRMRNGVVEDLAADTPTPQTLLHRHLGELKFSGLRRNQGTAAHGNIARDRQKDVSARSENRGDWVFQIGPLGVLDGKVFGDPCLVQFPKCNLIPQAEWPDADFGNASDMVMLGQMANRGTAER